MRMIPSRITDWTTTATVHHEVSVNALLAIVERLIPWLNAGMLRIDCRRQELDVIVYGRGGYDEAGVRGTVGD